MDETFILTIITLTITVLAAVEIPRLMESGIIRTIFFKQYCKKSLLSEPIIKICRHLYFILPHWDDFLENSISG